MSASWSAAGELAGAAVEAPDFGEGAGGDVVGGVGFVVDSCGGLKECEQAGFDFNGTLVGGLVEVGEFAVVAVDGELGFELVD